MTCREDTMWYNIFFCVGVYDNSVWEGGVRPALADGNYFAFLGVEPSDTTDSGIYYPWRNEVQAASSAGYICECKCASYRHNKFYYILLNILKSKLDFTFLSNIVLWYMKDKNKDIISCNFIIIVVS